MIVTFVILGAIQLGCAVGMYAICKRGVGPALLTIVGGIIGALMVSVVVGPGSLGQAFALFVVALTMLAFRASTTTYAIGGAIAVVLVGVLFGLSNLAKFDQLAKKYPMVSLAERLTYESAEQLVARNVSADAQEQLSVELSELNRMSNYQEADEIYRRRALEKIHASTVEKFVDSPGFGVGRMINPIAWLERQAETAPIPQPKVLSESLSASELPIEVSELQTEKTASSFRQIHRDAQMNFATSRGLGYVKDVEHVAGFEPHAFTHNPYRDFELEGTLQERMLRLELVSLLKHHPSRVYVSKNLPNMEELRDAPTRPLDAFETRALGKLQAKPAELVADTVNGRIRLLGGILAVERCLDCHQGKQGDLLGAFSYELQLLDPPLKNPAPTQKPKVL